MPFAGYRDFADCVKRNRDKDNPEAYCAAIMRKIEHPELKAATVKAGGKSYRVRYHHRIEPLVIYDSAGHLRKQECATCGTGIERMPKGWRHL